MQKSGIDNMSNAPSRYLLAIESIQKYSGVCNFIVQSTVCTIPILNPKYSELGLKISFQNKDNASSFYEIIDKKERDRCKSCLYPLFRTMGYYEKINERTIEVGAWPARRMNISPEFLKGDMENARFTPSLSAGGIGRY